MAYDYETLKELAHEQGIKVTDLIALAPQNDPFYCGTPGDLAQGRWFAELYRRLGFARNWEWNQQHVHIRRFHYALVSQDPKVAMPNGELYINTMQCWDFLLQASKVSRYLGLVPPESFEDKKNPEARVYTNSYSSEPRSFVYGNLYDSDIQLPNFPDTPYYSLDGFSGEQGYMVEVWCEKTTVDDIVIPLCQRYGANYQTGAGELSITATLKLVERIRRIHKPTRILYVSDFDPAGRSMPVAISRKLEFYIRRYHLEDYDIRLFPVVLTEDQVRSYGLPRTPIKDTERRKDHFENTFGVGATELDALEALRPGELSRILIGYMQQYYDSTLDDRVRAVEEDYRAEADDARERVLRRYRREINELETTYAGIRAEFEERMQAYTQQLQETWGYIQSDLEQEKPDITNYPLPAADEADEDPDTGLYNSLRDYEDQIAKYKQFQGK